jgi:VWFA-related protein
MGFAFGRALAACTVILLASAVAPLCAQEGPERESGDTVARPKAKQPADADANAARPADQEKIPSKLTKKPGQEPGPGSPTFRSDALTVSVDVAVLDNQGRFIPGIPAGNFRILEDNVPQKTMSAATGETPVTICMVIEFSARNQAYWSRGWYETLQAVYSFIQALKPEDQIAVVAFDMRSEMLSDFSTDRMETREALQRLRIPGFSESNMYDALTDVADRMSAIEGRKAILYIGTGMDTFSKLTFDQCRRKLQTAGVPVYSLATMQDARMMASAGREMNYLQAEIQLKTFAKETGGQAWFPRFSGEYPSIFRLLNDAMRKTYLFTYAPTNTARDGKFRKIKVELVNPATGDPLRITDEKNKPLKYQVIAKSGYTAPRPVE